MSAWDLPNNLWGGLRCYLGYNTITPDTATLSRPSDDCRSAFALVNIYVVFNLLFNIMAIAIVKSGGANMMWMASTVLVPLSDLVFSFHWMPRFARQTMGITDVIGLFLILSGNDN